MRRDVPYTTVGDQVWAFDLLTGAWSLQQVLETFVRDYENDAVAITVDGHEVETTQLHPFWVIDGEDLSNRPVREHLYAPPEDSKLNGRWVDAVDVQPGDTVFLQGSGSATVQAVTTKPVDYQVYNFSVDKLKCYAVGERSILVHNSNGIELPHRNYRTNPDDIAENMSIDEYERFGDPNTWSHQFTKSEPATYVGAPADELKVYEVWEMADKDLVEWHYWFDKSTGLPWGGKIKYPSTTRL